MNAADWTNPVAQAWSRGLSYDDYLHHFSKTYPTVSKMQYEIMHDIYEHEMLGPAGIEDIIDILVEM